ncbi:DUF6279 family lipoprotein [Shewanella pneumatophori]|uniref:DUF6279 family lipoprotein n=1 Tax=Shewanella pneumatophori TaxID=314092 RepID=A0A9X1Z8V8_9GAMM|nr:DUF6279 family lipoprotein [Shewanella pneumatophori]MCL1137048.1 DUF6279 family lipoprotein [Shewanella pneumatophori]
MRKLAMVVLLIFGLVGCSTKVGYYFLDWAIEWKLEEYVTLDAKQQEQFDDTLKQFLHWHRSEELLRYENQLAKLSNALEQQSLTPEIWADHVAEAKSHWSRTFDYLLPSLLPIISSFSDKQVAQIIAQLRVEEKELNEKYLGKDQAELVEMADERINKRAKKWLGKLSAEQKSAIHNYNQTRGATLDMWLEYRHEWIRLFSQALKNRHNQKALSHSLTLLMTEPDKLRSQAYKKALDSNTEQFGELLILLNQQASAKQKRYFHNKMMALQEDLIELSEDS